jgi:hypothetical protein
MYKERVMVLAQIIIRAFFSLFLYLVEHLIITQNTGQLYILRDGL